MGIASRIILTVVALATSISPYIADWSDTHVFNPLWKPHAKFHNGQTMSMGLCLGLLVAYYTWRSPPKTRGFDSQRDHAFKMDSLWTAAVIGSLYWVTAFSGILYPGALATDPEFGEGFPQWPIFAVILSLNWIGYGVELLSNRTSRQRLD